MDDPADVGVSWVMPSADPDVQAAIGVARVPAAAYADRILFLEDGQIVDEMREPTAERVLDRMKQMGH